MPIKSLDDWKELWCASSGTHAKKAQTLLQQYLDDAEAGVAGFTYPRDWYSASNGQNVRYLSSEAVNKALKHVSFDDDVTLLLRHVKENVIYFYGVKIVGLTDIPEGDELLLVLQVIKEKTGIDYFAIHLDQDQNSDFSHA